MEEQRDEKTEKGYSRASLRELIYFRLQKVSMSDLHIFRKAEEVAGGFYVSASLSLLVLFHLVRTASPKRW